MIEHEDYTIASEELLPVSQTGGLFMWLDIHAKIISEPYTVDGGDVAGYDYEYEIEIDVTEVRDSEDYIIQVEEKQLRKESWWKLLEEKVETFVTEY